MARMRPQDGNGEDRTRKVRICKDVQGVIKVGLGPSPNQYGTMPKLRADVLYGLSYLPTDRPIVKFLASFPASFPDTMVGSL